MIDGMCVVVNVMLSLTSVMIAPCFVRPIGVYGGEVMYLWSFCFSGNLGS